MRTDLKHSLGRQATLVSVAAAFALAGASARAAAPTTAPQVLLAITNSESMDGTNSGAIMVGSGSVDSSFASSSSPVNFSLATQPGFQPPINAGSGGFAPYTVACTSNSGYLCDNGPSRLNLAKAAISSVLATYGNSLNFGIYDYNTSAPVAYTTWVYYMSSGSSAFTFTNTASATGGTVANPCYNYSAASSAVQTDCSAIAGQYGSNVVATNRYITIGATSDNPQINDVLYNTSGEPAFLTYGGASPSTPYNPTGNSSLPGYTLSTYSTANSSFKEAYYATAPVIYGSRANPHGYWVTTPTNAGYVPFSNQVLYSERGFGYGSLSQSATTGNAQVAMSTDPASSTFTTALSPETNQAGTSEIKSVAGQSATYGLLNGALSYLQGLNPATCQSQYVVLLTDGLPTLDKSGNVWPPLGTTTATNFNVTASFAGDGTFVSSVSHAVTDAMAAITALNAAGIKVYVIGLGAGVDAGNNATAASLLHAMAIAGGTNNYFAANSPAALTAAFNTIVQQIYSTSAIAAPVAPISVAGGGAYQYDMISVLNPGAGHVYAYSVAADGTPSTTISWDAGALMNTSNRTAALESTTTTNTIAALGSIDAAAFNLTAPLPTCVPDVATIIGYTINPSYSANTGCNYLSGRQSGWYLGTFSTQNTGRYVGPPSASLLLQRYPTYAAYVAGAATRAPAVMFTNADGFLYSIDATTGGINWGWTSRNLLSQLKNYSAFAASGETDGNFIVADAMDSGGNWASYVVGSFQSGAEHFSLKLSSAAAPTSVVYDTLVTGGTSAGDLAGVAGSTPLRQPPVIAYIGNNAYAVYVVTVGSASTLYEVNIATQTDSSSVALPFKVSGTLTFNASTNELYMGGADGTVRLLTLTSGTAATSLRNLQTIGTTVNPATNNPVQNVLYVGYAQVNGAQYIYAENSTELTVFYVTSAGWTWLWASTPTQGYSYGGTAWTASSTVTTWTANSVASDIPVILGNALLLPVSVAGTGCSIGTGYYDLFNIATGAFPTVTFTINGSTPTSDPPAGAGRAFTPTFSVTSSGLTGYGQSSNPTNTSGNQNTPTPIFKMPVNNINKAVSWRQH